MVRSPLISPAAIAPTAPPSRPASAPAEDFGLVPLGGVVFGVLFFGVSAAAFVGVPLLSWAGLVPVNGEYGFSPVTLVSVLFGLFPTAMTMRFLWEPFTVRVDGDGAVRCRALLWAARIPATDIFSIDAGRRLLYWGTEGSDAPEDNPDRVVLLLRHRGGVVRLPHTPDTLAFLARLARRAPFLVLDSEVRALLTSAPTAAHSAPAAPAAGAERGAQPRWRAGGGVGVSRGGVRDQRVARMLARHVPPVSQTARGPGRGGD